MKKMTKTLSVWLLTAFLLTTMLTGFALQVSATDAETTVMVGDTALTDGDYLANGADAATQTKPTSGGYAYYNDGELTLHNFTLTGDFGIYAEYALTVVLEGENFITANWDEGIEGDEDLTIKGDGSLSITTAVYDGIEVDDGDLTVESGTLNITVLPEDDGGVGDGIDMTDGDIIINGGKITIAATDHGIESDNSIEDDEHFFAVIINGGTLDITAEDEGIDAEDRLEINGGKITIHDADIGLDCGGTIEINDGIIHITSRDDAIEASNRLEINGGSITLDADQCGLDSYGSLEITGGTLFIEAENGAIWAYENLTIAPKLIPFFGRIIELDGWYTVADSNGIPANSVDSTKYTNDLNTSLWLSVLVRKYSIPLRMTLIADEGGSIEGNELAKYGRPATYTFTPDEGYTLVDVKINGKSVGAVSEYTFGKLRTAKTIEAIFAPVAAEETANG